jgi:hypothetical protein
VPIIVAALGEVVPFRVLRGHRGVSIGLAHDIRMPVRLRPV